MITLDRLWPAGATHAAAGMRSIEHMSDVKPEDQEEDPDVEPDEDGIVDDDSTLDEVEQPPS
jgi:hypothetical protein